MRYQVFVPDVDRSQAAATVLTSVGLEDHAEGVDVLSVPEGPEGKSGLLFAWKSPQQTQHGYKPDCQTWIRSVPDGDRPAGAYWVGIWDDSPPTEEDTRRPYQQRGKWLKLNGDQWQIPQPSQIEATARLQDDGTWKYEPIRALAWFASDADKRRSQLTIDEGEGDKVTIRWEHDMQETLNWLCRVLRINYRITPEVAGHLGLWHNSTVPDAYCTALGVG